MQRYFGRKVGDSVVLNDDDVYHLLKVMRSRVGEKIEVVADERVFLSEITSVKPLQIKAIKRIEEDNELPNHVILVASLLKGDKLDFVLQKATELGVS